MFIHMTSFTSDSIPKRFTYVFFVELCITFVKYTVFWMGLYKVIYASLDWINYINSCDTLTDYTCVLASFFCYDIVCFTSYEVVMAEYILWLECCVIKDKKNIKFMTKDGLL